MFARAKKETNADTQLPKDVADLIDEMDKVAAPFDESELKEDEDEEALLVDGADATLFDSNAVWASPPQEKRIHSPDLSGLSDLSASLDDLAFLDEEIKQDIKKETHHDDVIAKASQASDTFVPQGSHENDIEALSLDDDEVHDSKPKAVTAKSAPAVVEKSFMLSKMWSTISKAHKTSSAQEETPVYTTVGQATETVPKESNHDAVSTTIAEEKEADKSNDKFNFVNIGNRLLDDSHDTTPAVEEDDPSINPTDSKTLTYKDVMKMVGTCLVCILKVTLQFLGLCARNLKATSVVLLVGTSIIYLKWYMPISITISVQPSAFNASMMNDLVPPPPQVEEIVMNETLDTSLLPSTTMSDFVAMIKVMALFMTVCLTGYSVLGRTTSSGMKNDEVVSTYSKHEDDCSRYSNLSLKELKALLRSRNLSTTGIHSHLVDRLVAHDNGRDTTNIDTAADIDEKAVSRNITLKALQSKLRTRNLTVTGLKNDLITKVWIPARREELKVLSMDELRGMLEANKLSGHGKSKDDLVRRLIEAGH